MNYKTSMRYIGDYQALEAVDAPWILRLMGSGGYIERGLNGTYIATITDRRYKLATADFSEYKARIQVLPILTDGSLKGMMKHLGIPASPEEQLAKLRRQRYLINLGETDMEIIEEYDPENVTKMPS